jgi:hypothetical protein
VKVARPELSMVRRSTGWPLLLLVLPAVVVLRIKLPPQLPVESCIAHSLGSCCNRQICHMADAECAIDQGEGGGGERGHHAIPHHGKFGFYVVFGAPAMIECIALTIQGYLLTMQWEDVCRRTAKAALYSADKC